MKRRIGFTLVELVVVIMILGILAGVAAPKLLDTSGAATDNGVRQSLAIIRDAIELYAADPDNGGQLPPCTGPDGADFKTALADYIRGNFPECPVGDAAGTATAADVAPIAAGSEDDSTGWRYDTSTGQFGINSDNATATDASVTYDTY